MKKLSAFLFEVHSDKKAYLFNFCCLLLIYWPIAFLADNFKWDMTDAFLPWRYHLSLAFHNSELPLWNAHQYGGYPIYADPQSGLYYPVVWVLSFLFGKYNILALHAEFILTAFIASCCFYKLCRFFEVSMPTAMFAGLMYACSGVFVGNTQHLCWLISAAYLPGIFYCFFSLAKSLKYKYMIALGLLCFLALTGGYPAFLIILAYILVVFFIYYAIQLFKTKQLLRYVLLCTGSALIALLCSFVLLYSFYTITPFIARGSSISLEQAMQNAFTPFSFFSFLLPFSGCKHAEIIGTDISMSNAYIGLFFFLALPVYFVATKKSSLEKILLIVTVVCLLVSVGEELPFRKLLFDYVPLMNYFRFPSAFRVFVVLFLLLFAAIQVDKQKDDLTNYYYVVMGTSLLLIGMLMGSIKKNYSGTGIKDFFFRKEFFDTHSTIYDHIIIQAVIQILLLLLFFALISFFKKHAIKVLYLMIVLDVYVSVHMNLPYTSLNVSSSPLALNKKIETMPDLHHIPEKRIAVSNDHNDTLKPLWKNLNCFLLEFGYDGWGPFEYQSFNYLKHQRFFKTISQNKPVYLAERFISISDTARAVLDSSSSTKIALVEAVSYPKYSNRTVHPNDTCFISAISGNRIQIEANVAESSTIALFQNYSSDWHCEINGVPQNLERINLSLIGIEIPPGKSLVKLEFRPKGIYLLSFTTVAAFVFFSLALIVCIRKNY